MKRMSVLLGAIAGLTLLALASGCGSAESRKVRAIEKGTAYLDAGEIDKARLEFQTALQLAPNDAEARYESGRVNELLGKPRNAAQLYQGAIAIQPDHVAARAALAGLYLRSGAADRALEVLKPGLEKHPDDAPMLAVRAVARSLSKDKAGAMDDATHAYRVDPGNENAIAVLAGLETADGRTHDAQVVLEGGIAKRPASVDLHAALGQLYASVKDYDKAEAQLRENVKLKPDQAIHRIRLAQFLDSVGKPTEAETVLRDAVAANRKDQARAATLVQFVIGKRGREAAEQTLKGLIKADPDNVELRFGLAALHEQAGDPAKADGIYREIIARNGLKGPGLAARTRLAMLRVSQSDVAGAQKLIAEVLAESPRDADALELRGNLALQKGDAKGAIADLRAVLRDRPSDVNVLRELARGHLANDEPALAEETLRSAIDANPANVDARLDLARLLMQTGQPERATPVLQLVVKDNPQNPAAYQGLFTASTEAKDLATAKQTAEAMIAALPKLSTGYYFRGVVAEDEHRVADALEAYRAALQLQPDAAEPLTMMVRLLVREKRVAEALQRTDEAASALPKDPLPLSLKGEVLVLQKRYAEAEVALRGAIARAPDWWPPYRALALGLVMRGDNQGAAKVVDEAIAKVKDRGSARFELAQLYESSGRYDEAVAEYETLVKEQPTLQAAGNNLAMLLASHRTDAASLERARELAKPFADSANPQFLDTFGWVELKSGNSKLALTALEKAHAAAPAAKVIQYHLGMAQAAAGQNGEARSSIAGALEGGARFEGVDEARTALAQLVAAK